MGFENHHIHWVIGIAGEVQLALGYVNFYSIVGAQLGTLDLGTSRSGNDRAVGEYGGSNSQLLHDRHLVGSAQVPVNSCAGRLEQSMSVVAQAEDCMIRAEKIGSCPGTWSGFQGVDRWAAPRTAWAQRTTCRSQARCMIVCWKWKNEDSTGAQ